MDSSNLNLKLLLDITQKKERVLHNILTICENQKMVLSNDFGNEEEKSHFFNEMGKEKQILIDDVQQLDQTFARLYKNISLVLKAECEKEENKYLVKDLQEKITLVTVLDTKIRKLEASIDFLLENKKSISDFRVKNILKSYNENNSKRKEF